MTCARQKRWRCSATRPRSGIGSFAAALGGLDTLVFAGGIGETHPPLLSPNLHRPEFLGIQLDETRNAANAEAIRVDECRATVRVIRTDEECMIAKLVYRVLDLGSKNET